MRPRRAARRDFFDPESVKLFYSVNDSGCNKLAVASLSSNDTRLVKVVASRFELDSLIKCLNDIHELLLVFFAFNYRSGGDRTHNLRFRKPVLCPIELRFATLFAPSSFKK